MRLKIRNLRGASALSLSAVAFYAGPALSQSVDANAENVDTVLEQIVVSGRKGARNDGRGYAPKTAAVGGKEPVSLRETPSSVTVVTRERMDDQNLKSVDDALKQVPGVSVVPWTATTSQIWLRGYLADVMYDGVPSYNTSLADTAQFDLSIYEQVEVLKGPAGLMKGVGTPGGTVNLVRKRGLDEKSIDVTTSVGSWNTNYGSVDLGGPLNADGSVRGRFVGTAEKRGFWHAGETRKHLFYGALDIDLTDRTVLSLSGGYQKDMDNSGASDLPAYLDGRFLDVPRSTHVYPDWNRFRYETWDVAAGIRHEFENDWVLAAKVNHRSQSRFWKDSFPATGVNPATMTVDYRARSADWDIPHTGFDVYVSGPVEAWGQEHVLTVGYNHEFNGSTGKTTNNVTIPNVNPLDPSIPEPDIPYLYGYDDRDEQGGFYGQARIRLADPLLLVAGARLSHFKAESRNIAPSPVTAWAVSKKVWNEFTPYAGLIYDLTSELSVYASYSDIFIPQTARRFDGSVLDPQIGAQVEAGLKASLFDGNLDASMAVFKTRHKNRSMRDPANPGFSIPAGESEVRGFEVELGGSPLHNLQLSAGYTFLDTVYIADQNYPGQQFSLFEPRHSFKAYARYTSDDPQWSGWSVAGGLHYSSGMIGNDRGKVRKQDDYVVLNAQVDYRVNENVTASLQVSNILDEVYYARVGGLNSYNTYGAPRAAMLTLRSSF